MNRSNKIPFFYIPESLFYKEEEEKSKARAQPYHNPR